MRTTQYSQDSSQKLIPNFDINLVKTINFTSNDNPVSFNEETASYCVGLVDMVNSTIVSSGLNRSDFCKYYSVFLNSMAAIIKQFDGVVIKNIGDSLLYYFPDTKDVKDQSSFSRCIECNLAMAERHAILNQILKKEKLPHLDYRISVDYGTTIIAKSESSLVDDIFGPAVNMCSKINHAANPNEVVVGGDFYEIIKGIKNFKQHQIKGYDLGYKNAYPVYVLERKNSQTSSILQNVILMESLTQNQINERSTFVGLILEKVLKSLGKTEFELISNHLSQNYNCYLFDCYQYPDIIKRLLKNMYGKAYLKIIDMIEQEIAKSGNSAIYGNFIGTLKI